MICLQIHNLEAAIPAVRPFLDIRRYTQGGRELVATAVTGAAQTMSDPADLTLDRLVHHVNRDEANVSNCSDQCAVNWSPLLVEEGQTPTGHDGLTRVICLPGGSVESPGFY